LRPGRHLGSLLGGLGVLLLASCVPAPAGPSEKAIAAALGPEVSLQPFYRALATNPTVVILQIGDADAASDAFSGRMRELLQARFGDAGRGVLPPGLPYRGYQPAHMSVTQEGWSLVSSTSPGGVGPFGITGPRAHADKSATMTLTTDDSHDLDNVEIEVLRQPRGGTLLAQLEHGSRAAIATNAPTRNVAWQPIPPATGSHTLTVEAIGDGPVELLAWRITRGLPGVIYSNLATVGPDGDPTIRWDPTLVRQELDHLTPSLIVLAVGTAAGLRDSTDAKAYAADLAERLRELHAAAPHAALLVLGSPDVYRRRQKSSAEPVACGDPNLTEPPNLGAIRAALRAVASSENAYFWDGQAAMGGACGILRLARTYPLLIAPDRTHLSDTGYRVAAEVLYRTIMDGYARYQGALRPSGRCQRVMTGDGTARRSGSRAQTKQTTA
jgi:lysophospholipase L1-like esterase